MVGGSRKSSVDSQKFKSDVEVIDLQRVPRNEDFDDSVSYMFLAGKGNSKKSKNLAVIKIYDHYFRFKKTNKFDEKHKRSQFAFKEVKRIVVYEDYPTTLVVFFEDDKTGILWYWFLRFSDIEKCSRCSQLFTDYILTLVATRRVNKNEEKHKSAGSGQRRGSKQSIYTNSNEVNGDDIDGPNGFTDNGSNLNENRQMPNGWIDTDALSLGQFAHRNGFNNSNNGFNANNNINNGPHLSLDQMYPPPNLKPNYAPLYVEEFDQQGLRRVIHYSDPYNERPNRAVYPPSGPPMIPYNEIEESPIPVARKPQVEYIEARRPKSALADVSEKKIIFREESPKVYIVKDAPEYKQPTQKVYLAKEASPRIEFIEAPKVKYVTQRNHHLFNDMKYEESEDDHQYTRNRYITVRPRSSAGYRAADRSSTPDYEYKYDDGRKPDYKFEYDYVRKNDIKPRNDDYNRRADDYNRRADDFNRRTDYNRHTENYYTRQDKHGTDDNHNTISLHRTTNPYLNKQNRLRLNGSPRLI